MASKQFPTAAEIAKKLVDSAIAHSEDAGEEHWKGDLETALRVALDLIPESVRAHTYLPEPEIQELFDNGLRMRDEKVFEKYAKAP